MKAVKQVTVYSGTVKPLYNSQWPEEAKLAVVKRWPLCGGSLCRAPSNHVAAKILYIPLNYVHLYMYNLPTDLSVVYCS